jgi:hypothetical protein
MWLSTSGRLCLADDGWVYVWDGEKHRRVGYIEGGPEVEACDRRDLRILADEWRSRDDDADLRAETRATFYRGLSA